MKIVNTSKNTIYIEDLDIHLPYQNGEYQEFSSEELKKSKALRGTILSDFIEILEFDENERIESSLAYIKNSNKKTVPDAIESTPEIQTPVILSGDDIEVKIHGIFYDAGGYAKVNRNLAIKLKESGCKVLVDPKRSQNQLNENELTPFINLTKTKLSKNHILIDSVIPTFGEMSSGKYKILYTTIESYSVPKQFIDCCSLYDEIWLTSPFSADILKQHVKNKPIYIVPAGVDHELYTPHGPKFDFSPNIKSFVFISVFGWNLRKGYDVLLKAYFDEFNADDDVSLLIVSRYQSGMSTYHKNKIKNDIDDIMKQFVNKDMPHLARYNKIVPERDMPKLYRSANAFILTSRGEGSCLPPVEASLCGLPLVITNCSGQTMYAKDDNSYLIDIDKIEKVPTGKMSVHYWDQQLFPDLTSKSVHDQVKEKMRYVVNNYETAKNKNKKLQNLILNNFTWNHTIAAANERLREISAKLKG